MQLIKCRYKLRCEISDCKSFADYTVYTKRTGVRNSLHLCRDCLMKLNELVQAEIAAKTVEEPVESAQTEVKTEVERGQPKKRTGGNGQKSKQ